MTVQPALGMVSMCEEHPMSVTVGVAAGGAGAGGASGGVRVDGLRREQLLRAGVVNEGRKVVAREMAVQSANMAVLERMLVVAQRRKWSEGEGAIRRLGDSSIIDSRGTE